ncbi:hypothetical protein EJ02DRAFT_154709 [Clathrospora elynae]|uniref:Uncharacterized protein n=1 Tax=Clathrospora elynae TaxID=706981 RepID=A0A6A5SSW6_9PLEO|nr:hypothetical protein EJ02DRAFT_154709 [Clathrospora elynae]
MTMDNTALHTFLFHCPTALRTVVLLGSWDNFARPYSLELDARGGRNLWKGCFTFSDIICDGDLNRLSPKRDGLLKMGGTYWYYYKVDEDEECHNPSEESTTFCPLLPGQRLNVLDIPREGHGRSNSDTSAAFTRNPKDRYITPVPPAPLRCLPSPRIGAGPESHVMPLPSPWTPRSATYPPSDSFLSPNVIRHARSASVSPYMPSTPIFPDFKVLKDKLASKRSASRNRSGSKARELDISSPVLVSGGEDLNLIPLSEYRPSIESIRNTPATTTPLSRTVPIIRKEFSPLGSHPVDPDNDSLFKPVELPAIEECQIRRRSHIPSTVITSEFKLGQSRIRANSADTRRTRHYLFSNDPWLSSPRLQEEFEVPDRVVEDDTPSAPVLSRPSSFLGPPTTDERPTSSHGSSCSPSLREAALEKELPALPRSRPEPFYAYNNSSLSNSPTEEPQEEFEEDDEGRLVDDNLEFSRKTRSHFSTWSNHSIAYSSPPSDDEEAVLSPTFSSFTSNDSDVETPQGLLIRYSYAGPIKEPEHIPTATEIQDDVDDENLDEEDIHTTYLSSNPPQLDLRISSFGSDLFDLDTQHSDPVPRSRRQAGCFGLGFQYSLPEDETTSKTTVTETTQTLGPTISVQRESSMSQLNTLMAEFAFLGDAVI